MTEAATAAEPADRSRPTEAEVIALNRDLARQLHDRVPLDARAAPKPEARSPRNGARRPLGLRPVPDDAAAHEARGDPQPPSASPAIAESFSTAYATQSDLKLVMDVVTEFVEAVDETHGRVASKFDEIRSRFENKIAALTNENVALKLILENLRITQRGERGIDGDRGPPGRDGRDGEGRLGPRGERGERGLPAPRISAWEIDDSGFVAYPLLSTGHKGPGLHLRGMFEAYNEQINAEDDAAEVDAAARSREAARREVAAKDWANR